jgi:hypothetical protein
MSRERRSRKAGARLGEPQKAREEKQLLARARPLRGLWEPLRGADPRSVAQRRRPPRFMGPMRFKIELKPLHEPRGKCPRPKVQSPKSKVQSREDIRCASVPRRPVPLSEI